MGNKNSKKGDGKKKGGKKKGDDVPEMKPEQYDFEKVDAANRIFGVDMQEVLKRFNIENMKSIPPPILALMDYIEHHISEKEVFKRDGSKVACNILNHSIDTGKINVEADLGADADIHVVVANLKKYIRSLPGGLLPYAHFSPLGDIADQEELIPKMKEAIAAHLNETVRFFYFHIARLLNMAMKNEENSMGIIDLTQVFRMNLMSLEDPQAAAKFTDRVKILCDATIEKFELVFPNPEEYAIVRSEVKKAEEPEEVEGEGEAKKKEEVEVPKAEDAEKKEDDAPAVVEAPKEEVEEKKEEVEEVKKEEEDAAPPAVVDAPKEEEGEAPKEQEDAAPVVDDAEEKKEEDAAPVVE